MTIPQGGGISRKSTRLPRLPTAETVNVVHSGTSWRKRALRRPATVVLTTLTSGCPSTTSRSVTRSFGLNRAPETTTAPGVVTVSAGRMLAAGADAAANARTDKSNRRAGLRGRLACAQCTPLASAGSAAAISPSHSACSGAISAKQFQLAIAPRASLGFRPRVRGEISLSAPHARRASTTPRRSDGTLGPEHQRGDRLAARGEPERRVPSRTRACNDDL